MAILSMIQDIDATALGIFFPAALLLIHLVPYLLDPHAVRSYPGPFIAKFSDAWLGWVSSQGHRSEVVHELHKKYGTYTPGWRENRDLIGGLPLGPFVRLAPNHVSISQPEALQIVYAHGNGALKSRFYDAFVSIRRGVFNTRDRAEHARKRKVISHIFSPKSVVEFEPNVRLYVRQLIDQWNRLYKRAQEGEQGPEGEGWRGERGFLFLDCLPCKFQPRLCLEVLYLASGYNYLAFDIIGTYAQ